MTVRQLYENLDARIPRALSCEGDNDGLMCCPDSRREVNKVLIALDATVETVSRAIEGGVNDSFAALLGLENVEIVENNGEKLMRVGVLPTPASPDDFAKKVKEVLGAPFVQLGNAGKTVSRVALLGGSGDGDINAAIKSGADTYVSGSIGYHNLTDAREMGINLIEAGHFYTEDHVCQVLAKMIKEIDESIVCDVISSVNITTI